LDKEQNSTSFLIRAVLDSNLPETEKSTERLLRESQVLIAAGTETTSMMLSKTIFHLISSPKDMEKLKLELKTAIPDPTITPTSLQLENLPYLVSRYVEESVGFSLTFHRML
jgi:cytochrome P450